MDQASPQNVSLEALSPCSTSALPLHVVTSHFVVLPMQTLSWRVHHDAVLSVKTARIWLTRDTCYIDYWLAPGETLPLRRGERIWIGVDGKASAEVVVTARYRGTDGMSLWKKWTAIFRRGVG